MIIVHSAPVRHVMHHLAALSAGQAIENEYLFELYTTTGADAARVGTGPTARPPRPGRLCPSRTAVPGLRSGQNGRAHRPVRARTADALAPPGRRRLHRACPAPPLCPSPGRLPTAPAGPAATPSASAASYGWSRPRTAGDSGGAPHESLEAQDPAPSLGFTLPAAAPGGSTHLSP